MTQIVEDYFTKGCGRCALWDTPQCKVHKWAQELAFLRNLLLDCGLIETIKWGVPCYIFQQNNVVLLNAFNDYCAVNFVKGALMSDFDGLLIQQTENVQATRQLRFTNIQQVFEQQISVKNYIFEAIEIEKAGLKVVLKKVSDFITPEEFQQKLAEFPAVKTAFEALTPGRQKGYLLYFAAPKQSQTRISRIEKSLPQIFDGKGIHD